MEKLIELLNEFRPVVNCANFKEHYELIDDDIYLVREGIDGEEEHFPMYVCYKKGDFVKWLVENNKIDFSKVKEKIGLDRELYDRMLYWYKEDDFLIMILSIENEPIRFLCEILK